MSLQKKVRDLELLSLAKQHQKNFNRDYRLQRKGLYEQSDDLFKPLLEQQEKQTEALKERINQKTIESKPNLPIELKTNNIGTKPLSKTWMFKQNSSGDFFLNNHPLIIEDGNIRLVNSNSSYPFTDKLKALLNGADISSIDDREALINYSNLTTEAKSSKSSVRSKRLMDRLKTKFGGQVITISENPKDLWKRLEVLTAAAREGHNNNLEEKSAILDKLLQLREITKKQYQLLL